MTSLHGGYDYSVISVHFLFYSDKMSAVVIVPVVLKDVRLADIDEIKKAIVHAMHLDVTEENLLSQIFDINLNKLSQMNSEDLKNMTNTQIRFIEIELLLKIAKKIKLTMMSLEEYLSHDAIVHANFEYDEPQQRVWNEAQNYLNQLAASDGLDRVI